MLRAAWRPRKSRMYQGNLAAIEGDMASPVAMARGDSRKTTEKYASCSSGLYRPGVTTR